MTKSSTNIKSLQPIDCLNYTEDHQCNVGKIELYWWEDPFNELATESTRKAAYICEDCAVVSWASKF